MGLICKREVKRFLFLGYIFLAFLLSYPAYGQVKIPIEVKGKSISYIEGGRKAVAKGNVIITYENMRLTCDEAEVDLDTNVAKARGNVVLVDPKGVVRGDSLEYDFTHQKGHIKQVDFEIDPYFGAARDLERKGPDHYRSSSCYITTCDPSIPHPLNYRLEARELDIYPNEKVVARGVRFKIGRYTLLYFPRYTHYFNDKRPKVKVVPGREKEWGSFLLTTFKQHINDSLDMKLNLDYREKRGFGFGPDVFYHSRFGNGLLRTYYLREKDIDYLEELGGRRKRDRYKIQIMHRWDISPDDVLVAEYHKFSDYYVLKDYYYNDEYEYDPEPASYMLFTHNASLGTLSIYGKKRANHFYTETEYLPQIKYQLYSLRLSDSNLYLSGSTQADNVSRRYSDGSQSKDAWRWDTYLQLLYASKLSVFEISPFVAMRQTYYSRDKDGQNRWRGVFYTGIDVSTKLYRVFDFYNSFFGIEKLRHVVRPWLQYRYNPSPTLESDKLVQFDSLDSISRTHDVVIGLDNTLQTKRDGNTVDIASFDVSAVYRVKPERGSYFDYADIDMKIRPVDWLRFDFEYRYGIDEGRWRSGSLDVWVEPFKDRLSIGLGHQYKRSSMAQTTLETNWRFIEGWEFRTYHRYEFETGAMQEQTYSIVKDLKCWEMEVSYGDEKYGGSTFWVIMRIKAFPDVGVRLRKSYRRRLD